MYDSAFREVLKKLKGGMSDAARFFRFLDINKDGDISKTGKPSIEEIRSMNYAISLRLTVRTVDHSVAYGHCMRARLHYLHQDVTARSRPWTYTHSCTARTRNSSTS